MLLVISAKAKGQNHRRKLTSCNEEFSKLQECFQEICNMNIHECNEFRDDSVVRYGCLQVLKKLVKNGKETAELKQQLSISLQRFVSNVGSTRKRTVPPDSQTPIPKRLCSRLKRITDPSKVSASRSLNNITSYLFNKIF